MNTRQLTPQANGQYNPEPGLAAYQEVWQVIRRRKGASFYLQYSA